MATPVRVFRLVIYNFTWQLHSIGFYIQYIQYIVSMMALCVYSYIAGVEFNDVAITVPPYLTQMERRAILRAATNLTGLNVFELMNSNTAGLLFILL